jgi:hypothetical protein
LKYLKIGKSYTKNIYKILWEKKYNLLKIDHDKLRRKYTMDVRDFK